MKYIGKIKRRAASGLTYSLAVGLIAIVAIASIGSIGSTTNRLFRNVGNSISRAGNTTSGSSAPAATITVSGLPSSSATQFSNYSFTATASGGTAPYSYSLLGSWPSGIVIDSNSGVVSGAPSVTGSFPGISVRATQSGGGSGDLASFTLTVSPGATPGQFENITSGSYNWTVPAGVTSISVVVVVVGGGGSGHSNSGGGGGGALAYKNNIAVTPGQVIPYVVGAGGVGAAAGSDVAGNAGGASSFNGTLIAGGGQGGSNTLSAAGGVPSGGDGGGSGGVGSAVNYGSGGGGGAGGYTSNGGNAGLPNNGTPAQSSYDGGGGGADGGYVGGNALGGGGGGSSGGSNGNPGDCWSGGGGGGVGIWGSTPGGAAGVRGVGTCVFPKIGGAGGNYGGGSGAGDNGGSQAAGGGAIRIIWPGNLRYFPATRTANE